MSQDMDRVPLAQQVESVPAEKSLMGINRRKFLGQAGAAATIAVGTLATPSAAFAQSGRSGSSGRVSPPPGIANNRVLQSFENRVLAATQEALIPVPPHTTNGDETRYADKSGSYSKGLLQDGPGRVNLNAYQSMKTALASGRPSDFENIILGGTRTLNGPQGSFAYGMEGSDAVQFGNAPSPANQESVVIVPPPPAVASAAYGTELVEMYWASLLRDVAFTDYPNNATAVLAAQELSSMPSYTGPRNNSGQVTPALLFRGPFPGETVGPYISQLMITPTVLGAQEISQQLITYLPNIDYMTDPTTWQEVQNGIDTGLRNQTDSQPRYLHDGRGLSALTHVDMLYQEHLTALLVLNTLGAIEPGQSLCPLPHSERLRHPRSARFRSFDWRSGRPGFGCGLVSEVADSPPPSSRVWRRNRAADADWAGKYDRRSRQQ